MGFHFLDTANNENQDYGRTERGFRNMEEVGFGETGMVPPVSGVPAGIERGGAHQGCPVA